MPKQPNISRITLGVFEPVSLPEMGGFTVRAKIDTGAYTGALHCTKIRVEEGKKGQILYFTPFGQSNVEVAKIEFNRRTVTSSNGKPQKRYFINTIVKIRGRNYPIVLSLADRSEMRRPLLIGRKFLRKNKFLVDPVNWKEKGGVDPVRNPASKLAGNGPQGGPISNGVDSAKKG